MKKKIALLMIGMVGVAIGVTALIVWLGAERYVAAEENMTAGKLAVQKVDVNTASARELTRLPGMGPEAAERVLRNRPYQKLDELIVKKVLGRKEFARIKERIRVSSIQEKTRCHDC